MPYVRLFVVWHFLPGDKLKCCTCRWSSCVLFSPVSSPLFSFLLLLFAATLPHMHDTSWFDYMRQRNYERKHRKGSCLCVRVVFNGWEWYIGRTESRSLLRIECSGGFPILFRSLTAVCFCMETTYRLSPNHNQAQTSEEKVKVGCSLIGTMRVEL